MTATDLPEFNVTLKMARSTGSLADEVEHRTFTVCGPARNAKHAEAIAFGLGHGINEASGSAWKFCGGSDGVTVAPAAEGHTEVEQLRAELDRVRADLAAAHNHAHRQDTNLQQIARAKDEIAAERDKLAATIQAFEETHGNAVYLADNLATVRTERDEFAAELELTRDQRDAARAMADELRDDLRAADDSNANLQQHIGDIRTGAF